MLHNGARGGDRTGLASVRDGREVARMGGPAGARGLYAEERRAAILQMLDQRSSLQVAEVADAFGVSRVTARADLDALERDGKLRRTHGGAVSLSRTLTVSIQDSRVNVHADAKRAIGARAAGLVGDGDSILVDSGTTALELVRALGSRVGVTVVTDDFTIADFVDRSMPALDVVMLGGSLRKGHRYTCGPLALAALGALHPDIAFVSPTALVPGRGLMTNYQAMAELKRAFLSCADRTVVLLDSSKVGGRGLMRFGSLRDADAVVCEADPEGVLGREADESGCRLLLAPASPPAGEGTDAAPARSRVR